MVIFSGLPAFDCNIAILGAGGVGKTSLLKSLFGQSFSDKHTPTLGDYYMHTVAVDGAHHNLCIVDTAGTHSFPVMRQLAISSCEGFVIVYSLDSPQSFREAMKLLDEVISIRKALSTKKIPVVLVANKLDIDCCERKVSASQGKGELEARVDIKAEYVEASGKCGFRVESVFHSLVRILTAGQTPRKRSKLIAMISKRKSKCSILKKKKKKACRCS